MACPDTYTAAFCEGAPSYQQLSNGTGCCTDALGTFAGQCDECTRLFSCPARLASPFSFERLGWGAWCAIGANSVISVGLGLQKWAHVRMRRKNGDQPASLALSIREPAWVMGTALTLTSEIGNFVAYGDPSTPAAVVASLGCVGVIANWLISITWLKEAFRCRDVGGVLLVICGVVAIIFFVPKREDDDQRLLICPLLYSSDYYSAPCGAVPYKWPSGGRFDGVLKRGAEVCSTEWMIYASAYWFLWQPKWLVFLCVCLVALALALAALKRYGPRHPASFLIIADIAGGFTVSSAVIVSTFLFSYAIGGGKWYALIEPIFLAMLLVLAGTAFVQIMYLNQALAHFDASIVIPTHYVLFTIFSILGPSILYQQLTMTSEQFPLPGAYMYALFLCGIGLTFLGVVIISTGHDRKTSSAAGESGGDSNKEALQEGSEGSERPVNGNGNGSPALPKRTRSFSDAKGVFLISRPIPVPGMGMGRAFRANRRSASHGSELKDQGGKASSSPCGVRGRTPSGSYNSAPAKLDSPAKRPSLRSLF